MLRWDVVHAVKTGQFNVYAVSTVNNTVELLSDITAGVTDEQGHYPQNYFNERVDKQLL